jgi:hypothetical protein
MYPDVAFEIPGIRHVPVAVQRQSYTTLPCKEKRGDRRQPVDTSRRSILLAIPEAVVSSGILK